MADSTLAAAIVFTVIYGIVICCTLCAWPMYQCFFSMWAPISELAGDCADGMLAMGKACLIVILVTLPFTLSIVFMWLIYDGDIQTTQTTFWIIATMPLMYTVISAIGFSFWYCCIK
eukprot:486188_1